MRITIGRALRGLLPAAWLALTAASAVAAAGTFTPAEQRFIDQLPTLLERQCSDGARKGAAERAATSPPEIMAMITGPDGVCGCVGRDAASKVTPDMLHAADFDRQLLATATKSASRCLARGLRVAFPQVCASMASSLLGPLGDDGEVATARRDMCRCMETRLDALTPGQLQDYLTKFIAARNAGQPATEATQMSQAAMPGLQSDMRDCGFDAAAALMAARAKASAQGASSAPASPDAAASTPTSP